METIKLTDPTEVQSNKYLTFIIYNTRCTVLTKHIEQVSSMSSLMESKKEQESDGLSPSKLSENPSNSPERVLVSLLSRKLIWKEINSQSHGD